MLKTVLSLTAAISLLIGGGYSPSMTEIDHVPGDIVALTETAAGKTNEDMIYSVEHLAESDIYTNHLDGYKITVPYGLTPDASLSNIRFRLSGARYSVEIFKESFSEESDCSTYISYSNRFTDDSLSCTVELQETTEINGLEAHILKWSRPTLGADDKNHYVNIDFVDGTDVYTVTIKSAALIDDWREISESFCLVEPTVTTAAAKAFRSEPLGGKNAETAETFERIFGENSGLNWGLMVPREPVNGTNGIESIERSISKKMDICLFYFFVQQEYNGDVYKGLSAAWDIGKISELTMQFSPSAPSGIVYDVLKGGFDGYLDQLISDVKDFGHPVLMRLFNEMNGEWCNYSGYHTSRDPEVYIRLYRYIVDKFRAAGAENVIWVWNPNEKSFPNFRWNSEEMYYPGNDYVDVVGLTGYNTGTYYEGEKWRSFDRIYENIYAKADMLYQKPLMITEFSCSTAGGDKVEWVRDMFASLHRYPKLKAAVWWSGCDYDPDNGGISRSYFIDDTEGVMALFRENIGEQ